MQLIWQLHLGLTAEGKTNLGKTNEKGATVVNLGAYESVNQRGENRRRDRMPHSPK